MPTYKTISSADIKSTRSNLNQLIDFVEEDVSGSNTRKKYQVYVTGTTSDSGVTSSLFQTVFDQQYNLQTANELFDLTVGLFKGSSTVTNAQTNADAAADEKLKFVSESLMMREKVNIYRQYAQLLLGDADTYFVAPGGSSTESDRIHEALFINFKRLFVRDGIKRETFAMRFFKNAASATANEDGALTANGQNNIYRITDSGSVIFTDVGSATSIERSQTGGDVGNLKNASNTSDNVGLLYYQAGIAVLDLAKITSGTQHMSGTISAVGNSSNSVIMGASHVDQGNPNAKFIPDFVVSASIDDIVDHISTVRFGSAAQTFMTFQNNTQINSTLVFCRATADEFNFSSNPTYVDGNGRIKVIDTGQENSQQQKSFSFVTTVGLYDASEQLIAVAKLSRPVEKNDEKDLTFRVRLDF